MQITQSKMGYICEQTILNGRNLNGSEIFEEMFKIFRKRQIKKKKKNSEILSYTFQNGYNKNLKESTLKKKRKELENIILSEVAKIKKHMHGMN
jgi:hypothetical protein